MPARIGWSGRFFLDTNVFVYSFDRGSEGKRAQAVQLIQTALSSHKGVVSFQVVQEFLNLALKRFARPFDRSDAEAYLSTVLRPMLAVHSTAALYSEALRMAFDGGFSWYDSLIVAAALQAECGVLYSEDLQHGRKVGALEIVNPFL